VSWDSEALRTPATAYAQTLLAMRNNRQTQNMINKYFYFISALYLTCSTALGQETKVKQHDSEKFYEEYSVLVTDKKIKHGQYALFIKPFIGTPHIKMTGNYRFGKKNGTWVYYFDTPVNQIKETGTYKDDLKDSLWVTYYPEAKFSELFFNKETQAVEIKNINTLIRSLEYYKEGKPTGVWESYSEEQNKVQAYDFASNSLQFDINLTDKSKGVIQDAIFIGGDYRMKLLLHDSFDFQELMKGINNTLNLKSGALKIEVIIDSSGKMRVNELENTINNEKIVKRAFLAVDSLKGFWVPGKKSTSRLIKFKINQNVTHTPQHYKYSKTISVEYSIEL